MKKLYTNREYVEKLVSVSRYYQTYYAWGAFGAPASYKNKVRYKVPDSLPTNTFLFDFSGFAYKAIPWGWCGDETKTYGGATYKEIPELETNNILSICTNVSSDFSQIAEGEVLYMKGHVGYYIGDGLALECTTYKNVNRVIISNVTNVCKINGHPYPRKWLKHGKMPFLRYPEVKPVEKEYTTAKLGEGLIKIAKRSGITFDEIKRLNPNIKAPLYIVLLGQKVRIK